MARQEELQARREQVIQELAGLDQIRRGSITQQCYQDTRKDGTKVQRGPYPLYTFKEQGKTRSRRIRGGELELEQYQQQIQAFHRFQELTDELLQIGEQLSDLALQSGKKKRPGR